MRIAHLVVIAVSAALLTGCCGDTTKPSLFGAKACDQPVYRAPSCADRPEVPAAPQATMQLVPIWEEIRWPWQCDEARRGQPVYKKPDCKELHKTTTTFFGALNSKMFGCEPAPAPQAAPSPCK